MRSTLRTLGFGLAMALATASMAQQPYTWIFSGTIAGCTPGQVVTIQTIQGTQPPQTVTAVVDSMCHYEAWLYVASNPAWAQLSTLCGGMNLTAWDSAQFNFFQDTAYTVINLSCGGGGLDCMGVPNGPNVPGTPCNDGNPLTVNDTWDANCVCTGVGQTFCQASFTVQQGAPWEILTMNTSSGMAPFTYQWWMPDGSSSNLPQPNYVFNAPGVYGICLTIDDANGCSSWMCDTVVVDSLGMINTGAVWFDCLGILWGPNVPGSPCDDGNPNTMGDVWDANCGCSGQGGGWVDCLGVPNGPDVPGAACDDNDPLTAFSYWSWNCVCVPDTSNGFLYDCMGVLNGPAMPGTPCDDGDPNTFNDTWDGSCNCVGSGGLPCEADFIVTQAYDSLQGPIPGTIWVFFLNNGGQGFTYAWDFGDGTTSNVPFSSHTYSGNGPYLLCLTVSGFGCTDTYCDSVGVDANGIILPMGAQSQGFTINVMGGTTAIDEVDVLQEVAIAPNPVNDVLTLSLNSTLSGALQVDVLDVTGKLIHQQRANLTVGANTLRLDLAHLEAGPYLLRLNAEGFTRTEQFVRGH
ncbi:MAG: T9SS type A sorting domain-containing protein [Flavobacteriales bacterium]|nr:T9SS type A sorting domain-containing protein [Flavobacteriales bacterium]